MMPIVFWVSIGLIIYVYIGYPVLIFALGTIRNRAVLKGTYEPMVTVLIAAYNESADIAETIRNKLSLDYPSEKLEVLVVSDASEDGTDDIVLNFAPNVKLIRQEKRKGKTAALNLGVSRSTGDIIVFSDANSIYDKASIKKLVQNFNDPQVGYVTGKMVYTDSHGSIQGDGCSAYMRYENFLRRYETKLGSIVGVDGGIDAIRREIYEAMKHDQLPDFVLPLTVLEKGYRIIYEPEAILKENSLESDFDEYKMRVRVSLRAMWALFDMRRLLGLHSGDVIYALQLWSHKVLRYGCFIFFLFAFISNISLLSHGGIYAMIFILQVIAIIASAITFFIKKPITFTKLHTFLKFFTILNVAAAHAFLKFMLGKKQVTWEPRKG